MYRCTFSIIVPKLHNFVLKTHRELMILRIARVPISGERHGGVRLVLRTPEDSDVLGRIGNRCSIRLVDTVRVLEHKGEERNVRNEGSTYQTETRPAGLSFSFFPPFRYWTRALSSQVNARCSRSRLELGLRFHFCSVPDAICISVLLPTFSFTSFNTSMANTLSFIMARLSFVSLNNARQRDAQSQFRMVIMGRGC